MTNLLVVESPSKAKTIKKYLGADYAVVASFGHIRDLPSKDGSVDVNNNFKLDYRIIPTSSKHVQNILAEAKKCDLILLACDPDREGEAIAWHVAEILREKKLVKAEIKRVVFNEITKVSVTNAIKKPRDIDMNLVNAQQTRLSLDYLVGFGLSPVLWRKIPGSKSAGRVQSVALRLICDREREIRTFKPEEYWSIKAELILDGGAVAVFNLTHLEEKKLEKFDIKTQKQAEEIAEKLAKMSFIIDEVINKDVKRKPLPPFTTSTLQQEASKRLGFTVKKTMMVAQKLYEGADIGANTQGLITYMRTDGVYIDDKAVSDIRNLIGSDFGKDYLPNSAIIYKNKIKNAQEAHEAIRPVDFSLSPEKVSQYLDSDSLKLYKLIWNRAIACQMADAIINQVSVVVKTNPEYAMLRTSYSAIKFDGFYRLYREESDDEFSNIGLYANAKIGAKLDSKEIKHEQHFTEPPPYYNEASLVKKMEEIGIGRPSTYASTISILLSRSYVKMDGKKLLPEDMGIAVSEFLKAYFPKYVEYDYTSHLEDGLDSISNGEVKKDAFLAGFWKDFNPNVENVKAINISEVLSHINEGLKYYFFKSEDNGTIKNQCPSCGNGKLNVNIGKFGIFIGCSNYPTCKYIQNGQASYESSNGDATKSEIAKDREFAGGIKLKKGPYGYYLEIDDETSKGGKKRTSIPSGLKIDDLTDETAAFLISMPRKIGEDENGNDVKIGIGKFGPYLLCDGKFTSVKGDIFEITIEKAREILEKARNKSEGDEVKKFGFRKSTSTKTTAKKTRITKKTDKE